MMFQGHKEKGYWNRKCSKYVEDKKNETLSFISYVNVIEVLTTKISTWVLDTKCDYDII